ncbi:MAG: NUDIX hydrolase [Desulfobacteraceae bacterium]|nr:NUDIX hydrolase [Desulfobacteraceae bacterium]
MNFCQNCGGGVEERIPPGDDRNRAVCARCGRVYYQNPIMVVGCIPLWEESVLLCRRDIEPCRGLWTLPAGYLENGETVEEGAMRETWEETRARVELIAPYRLFNITFVNQIYMMFLANLGNRDFGPTPESSEVRLFKEAEIPWNELAFTVIHETLRHFFEDRKNNRFPFSVQEIEKSGLNLEPNN